jgi:hypothetical protein
MLSLEKSPNFIKDHKRFQDRISQVPNDLAQKDMNKLLERLLHEVRKFDKQHKDVGFNNRLPPIVIETKSNIASLRHQLDQKLLEWEMIKTHQ